MAAQPREHDWSKEKPHHATTGKITTRRYAENNPKKVEWVKDKKKR